MEVFRGPPKLFDDNFVKDWTKTSEGTSSFSTDGDIATLGAGDQAHCYVDKDISFNTTSYPKIAVRIPSDSENWGVMVYYDGAWHAVWANQTVTGLQEETLTSGKDVSKIRITADGTGKTAKFDYIAIMKDTVLIPVDETKSDIIENLTITLPLLNRGVGGFSCKLPNMDAEYTGKISDFDHILIYLWRKGTAMTKVFGGKILLPGTEGFGTSQEYYLLMTGMDIGQELLVSPNLMDKKYSSINGKTIIEEAIDLCNEVTKKFVDVDTEIASTHDFEFELVKSYAIITQVCVQAKTVGGVVGFDAYVDPAGNAHVFKRGKYTSSIDLTGKIEHYKKEDDVHRVRNKIWVFGAREKKIPYDGDTWTEDSTSPDDGSWSSGTGTGSVSVDTSEKVMGSKSIKLNVTGSDYYGRAIFTLNSDKYVSAYKARESKSLSVQLKLEAAYSGDVVIQIEDSSGQILRQVFTVKTGEWLCKEFPIGPENESAWSPDEGNTQAFDWKNIKIVDVACWFPGTGTGAFWIDGSHFDKCRFGVKSTHSGCDVDIPVEDATSQSKYRVRCGEPVIDDGLKSDNECLKKAESLRDFLKEKVVTLSDFRVEGDNGFTPGYRQRVIISNDNIDDYFRILEIQHVIRGVQWDTILTLSNEPQMIDYVFADLHRELRRLSVSKGKGNPGGGTAGERYMGASRVVRHDAVMKYDYDDIQLAIDSLPED